MDEIDVIKDFVLRCQNLEMQLEILELSEKSSRVWVSVLLTKIQAYLKIQENPEAALQQVLDILQMEKKNDG